MSLHTRYLPRINSDRRAFALVGGLAVIWLILYNNLQPIADWITYTVLNFSHESRLGEA